MNECFCSNVEDKNGLDGTGRVIRADVLCRTWPLSQEKLCRPFEDFADVAPRTYRLLISYG